MSPLSKRQITLFRRQMPLVRPFLPPFRLRIRPKLRSNNSRTKLLSPNPSSRAPWLALNTVTSTATSCQRTWWLRSAPRARSSLRHASNPAPASSMHKRFPSWMESLNSLLLLPLTRTSRARTRRLVASPKTRSRRRALPQLMRATCSRLRAPIPPRRSPQVKAMKLLSNVGRDQSSWLDQRNFTSMYHESLYNSCFFSL